MNEIIALIGLLLTVASMVGGAVWLLIRAITGQSTANEKNFEKVHDEIRSVGTRLTILERDNYTKPEAEAHALRLALNNPHLKVPDPRDPARLLRVGDTPQENL